MDLLPRSRPRSRSRPPSRARARARARARSSSPSPSCLAVLAGPLVLLLASFVAAQDPALDFAEIPPQSERPFTSIPAFALLAVMGAFGILGAVRAILPRTDAAPARWIRSVFAHALRIGWLAFVPALVLDGLIFFMGGRYSHAWTIGVLFFALAPFAAGLQWEKPWWNARKRREEAYVPAFNYFVGIALVALIPALVFDAILAALAERGLLIAAAMPLNLLALGAVAGSTGFIAAWIVRVILGAILRPHRAVLFFLSPQSRFYAVILTLSLGFMAAFNYMTLPAFFEVISAALPPRPAITADQAFVILLPNTIHLLCVTYFSIFAGSFVSMLPIILFSKSLRKKAETPPNLRELLDSPERARAYLGREFREEDILPTIVTVTAYNEPPEPLEKTLFGYLKVAKRWIDLGLPRDRYVILFSHQTEREEERAEFETFLHETFPGEDPLGLIDRDWSRFDEDNPAASIRSDARCRKILEAWLERKKLDPASKAGRSEFHKRLVCQRMIEFSHHVPRQVLGMPDPPERTYAGRSVGWVWYYLIPKAVGGRSLQMNSKAHNLYYAREGVWGKAATSPLARDGIFNEYEEWIYDASDADCEIHESCVDGILASYSPMYREPRLGWLQRLSYTIEPTATFLSAVKSASETAYWSWYLRARVHTYKRRGKPVTALVGGVERPVRRDFQAANGHNLVVRGTSIREAGGDIEHEIADVHSIEPPIARWLARLSGKEVPKERATVERWVPTGEDLELATRMALEGYYGDYAVYAPQGEGSPADFRGNVPQAIRWSGNNVQLVFMHIAKVFTSAKLTFNEKMGYFVNLATLASAPLLYLTLLRSVIAPFLDIPDVYAVVHPGLGPLAFILALAPNFLLLSLALAGQLVVRPSEPWQRSVLGESHRKFLQWVGYFTVPPLTILLAAFLPGWLEAAKVPVPDGVSWGLVIAAVNINLFLLVAKREVYASLAYCIVLLPFLQVLYLSWVIFGIIGCLNMLVKTQIVEPYISRLAGTAHPPVAGRYPSDGSGRFLSMNARFPWLFAPIRFARSNAVGLAVLLALGAGIWLWTSPPAGLPREVAAIAGFAALLLWLGHRLGPLLDDWFLDKDSLANRWWDYWTNPQPAFVKTLKEREERSLGTLVKDNIFGILNGLVVLGLILHVHFVNAADFSAALLAYLTFSIAASWIISPFFYEEPHRKLRSQGKAAVFAVIAIAACLAVPLGALDRLQSALGIRPVPAEVLPWLELLLAAIAIGALVNLAPWAGLRAFAKRFALASIMIGLLFLNALAISYRGVSITPLFESWALEADRAYGAEVRREAMDSARAEDLEVDADEAERSATLALLEERMAADWLEVLEERVPPARKGLDLAAKRLDLARKRLAIEESRSVLPDRIAALDDADPVARAAALATILEWGREEKRRREERYREAVVVLDSFRRDLEAARGGQPPRGAGKDEAESGGISAEDLEDLVRSFEAEMVEPLRKDIEVAEDFLVRVRSVSEKSDGGSLALLEMGDIHAARATLEREERKLADAEGHARSVEAEARGAAEHCLSLRLRREAAARRAELARAEHAQAETRPHATASLRAECRERATRAYWTRPRRLEQLRKDLARHRETLEREESRAKLCEAVRWAASHHLVQSIVLEGRPWYPRRPVLEKIEKDLPAAIARLDAAMLDLDRASVEAGLPRSASEPPSLAPHIEQLEERHRRAIAHERRTAAKIRLDGRLDELNTWREIVRAAQEGELETLLPGKDRADALEALGAAALAARRAIEARTDLVRIEDQILGDIERLEPYLVGDPALAARAASAPGPILLLARERAHMEKDLDEARETLADRLEAASRASRLRLVEGSQPEVERRRGDFLESAAAAREGVDGSGEGPVDFVLRRLHALAIDAGLGEVGQILDGKARGHTAGGDGASRDPLAERLERARTEVASASLALERAPSDPTLADVAMRRSEEARRLEGEVEAAWNRADGALAIAARLEPLLHERVEESLLARAAAGAPLESLGKDAARAVEDDLRLSDVLAEKLREAEAELRRAGAEGSDIAAAERLFTDVGSSTPEEEEAAVVAERIRFLEGEIARLRSAAVNSGATPSAADEAAAPPSGDDGGPPEPPRRPPEVIGPKQALDEAARRAREPGGAVFLARKEIDAAGEDLALARQNLLPGLFGSLGGNTSAPAVFQGGGFALVTLSLDRFKNPEIFEHEEAARVFLRELADLGASFAALRASASVAAAEIELARIRGGSGAILERAGPARTLGDPADPGRTWLEVEEARLRVLVAGAEADLARARRELAMLLGRSPGDALSMGFEEPLAAPALRARIDAWLEDAGRELARRFPEHPAFRISMASVRAQEAKAEEARLQGSTPVFRAGAGAAAPAEVVFTVGASLIQPLHDAGAEAQDSIATSQIVLERTGEERRVELLGRRRAQARAERAGSPAESERKEGIFAAALSTLDASVLEETAGLGQSARRIADDMGAAREALAGSGGPLRSYIEKGIDLVETGGLDGASEPAARPAPGREDELRAARVRLGVADAKLDAAETLIHRVGIGASVSYSSILLPVPAVELSYGRSERARSAAAAGLRREEVFLAHEASRRARTALDREIDARADAALVSVLEARVELRRRRLDLASSLEREGREAPLAVEWTRKQLLEAEAAVDAARGRAAARAASAEPVSMPAPPLPPGWTGETAAAVAPASPATRGISPESARALLAAEEEHRFRALAAAIESKKPYGGNIGNFISPLWDLFRLYARRPGTRAEIDAALAGLRERLLHPEAADAARVGDDAGDTAFEEALERAKDALGGDPYDPAEVGVAIRSWREAEVALRRHDREAARAIAAARADHLSSLEALEWLEGRAERARGARARAQAAAALNRPDPLGVMLFEDDLLGIEEARVEALRRDALARSALVELGGPIDVPDAAPPSGPRPVTPAELALIVSRRDPEVIRLETALEARREEAAMVEAMGNLGVTLPEVLPSLAVDPRFGGAGLTGGSSFFATLEPDQRASVVRGDVDALERELSAARLEAGLEAIEDALTLRGARDRAGALAAEARRLETELAGLRARSDDDDRLAAAIAEAEGLLRRTESSLEEARLEEMEARARIDARAGEPLVVEGLEAAGGDPVEPTRAAVEEWVELARREDDAARAAGARAGGWKGSAEKRRYDKYLATKLEAIASLGQTPDDAEPGIGGYLAIPLARILGLTRGLERKDAVRAEAYRGLERRLEDEAAARLESLALALEDRGLVLDAAEDELELARAAEDEDARAAAGAGKPSSPGRWLDSIESHRRAELDYDLVRFELEGRLEELRGTGDVKIERRSRRKPRPAPRSPDDARRVAELIVRELSRLEREEVHELEEIEVEKWILAESPPERPLRRSIEPGAGELDTRREVILASSPRPGVRLGVGDIGIAEALAARGAGGGEGMRSLREMVSKLDGAMADLRRAKIEDSLARGKIQHQGDLRREIRGIALRPRHASAVEALAGGLRAAEKESPGTIAAVEERFRSAQLAASMRLAARLPPERSGLDAEWIELRQGMAAVLSPEGRAELDAHDAKRSGCRHAGRLAAGSARDVEAERDVFARKELEAAASDRASSAARGRAELEASARRYLESTAGRDALAGALEGFRAGRLARLAAHRGDIAARLAAARAAEPARRPLLAERSLEALASAAGPGGVPGDVAAASVLAVSRIGNVRRAAASARAGLVDVSGAAALDAAGSKERLERRRALALAREELEAAWSALVEASEREGLLEPWRRETARMLGTDVSRARKVEREAARRIPIGVRILVGEDLDARARAATALRARGPSRLAKPPRGGRGEPPELQTVLRDAESAASLRASARELVRRHAESGERTPGPSDLETLERTLREAAALEGVARSNARSYLEGFARERPAAFLRWVREGGIGAPSPRTGLAALRSAVKAAEGDRDALRLVELLAGEARDDLRVARSWKSAEAELDLVRREVHDELEPPALRTEAGATTAGYADARGRLLTLPEIAARDRHRMGKAIDALAEMEEARGLKKPVGLREAQDFIDLQVERSAVAAAPGAQGGPGVSARARSFGDADTALARTQGLAAIAKLVLLETGWAEEGLEQAVEILRAARRSAEEEGGGFRGVPRACTASAGEIEDDGIDLEGNALVAIACQRHAGLSGSDELVPFAREIIERVLLPNTRGAGGDGLAPECPPGLAALTAAALRNQAQIERVLGSRQRARRFLEAAVSIEKTIAASWDAEEGRFRGGATAGSDLWCLAVLSRTGGITPSMSRKAARSLRAAEEIDAEMPERYTAFGSSRNWFVQGPLIAYERMVRPAAKGLGTDLPEVTEEDAWRLLNGALYRMTDGRLGFSIEVRGLAATRTDVGFEDTAHAAWVFGHIAASMEETAREGAPDEVRALAGDYGSALANSAMPDPRNPLAMSWPYHPGKAELELDARRMRFDGKLSTDAACHWVFAASVRRRIHPLFTDSRKLEAEIALGEEGFAAGEIEAEIADIEERLRSVSGRLAAMEPAEPLPAAGRTESAVPVPAPFVTTATSRLAATAAWILRRISPAGLVQTNDDPEHRNACHTYVCALAVIHLARAAVVESDADLARAAGRIWSAMQTVRGTDGSWADAYDGRTGAVYPGGWSRATGPNAWMALAGVHLHAATGDAKILEQAGETLRWILGFQDAEEGNGSFGAVTLGVVPWPKAISTEANADFIAACAAYAAWTPGEEEKATYCQAAGRAADFMVRKLWIGKRFATGSEVPGGEPVSGDEWLDSQTWTYLALRASTNCHDHEPKAYEAGLSAMEDRMARVPWRGKTLVGFGKVTLGDDAFWAEGTAGYVLAARAAGKLKDEPRILASLDAARLEDGALPHIIGKAPSIDWKFDLRHAAVDGTVWAAWADPAVDFDPFEVKRDGAPVKSGGGPGGAEPKRVPAEAEKLRRKLEGVEKALEGMRGR